MWRALLVMGLGAGALSGCGLGIETEAEPPECQVAGGACSASSDCCSGYACFVGVCVAPGTGTSTSTNGTGGTTSRATATLGSTLGSSSSTSGTAVPLPTNATTTASVASTSSASGGTSGGGDSGGSACGSGTCPAGLYYCDLNDDQCEPGCAFDAQCGAGSYCDLTQHACASGCGEDSDCAAPLACINHACACRHGETLCGDTCVDTTSDANNCGGCGIVCSQTNYATDDDGETYCQSSVCACDGDDPSTVMCGTGASAICTDTSSDPNNCGGCGTKCPPNEVCNGGCTAL